MNAIESFKQFYKQKKDSKKNCKDANKIIVKELFNLESIWVALSKERYSVDGCISIPLISNRDKDLGPNIFVFSRKEYAVEWAKHYNHFSPDIKYYLVGKIDKNPLDFRSFYQTASALGAIWCLLDEGYRNVPITLCDIFEQNGLNPRKICSPVCFTEEEAAIEYLKQGFKVEFFPIKALKVDENQKDIIDRNKVYEISKERGKVIKGHILYSETAEELYDLLMKEETLNENCCLYEEVMNHMYPMAMKEKNEVNIKFCNTVACILIECIWDRLFKDGNVFILRESDDKPLTEGFVLAAYTDYYRYTGNFKYYNVNNEEELYRVVIENEAKGVIVTDGPYFNVAIDITLIERWRKR